MALSLKGSSATSIVGLIGALLQSLHSSGLRPFQLALPAAAVAWPPTRANASPQHARLAVHLTPRANVFNAPPTAGQLM